MIMVVLRAVKRCFKLGYIQNKEKREELQVFNLDGMNSLNKSQIQDPQNKSKNIHKPLGCRHYMRIFLYYTPHYLNIFVIFMT